jgi:hypothetical protein
MAFRVDGPRRLGLLDEPTNLTFLPTYLKNAYRLCRYIDNESLEDRSTVNSQNVVLYTQSNCPFHILGRNWE